MRFVFSSIQNRHQRGLHSLACDEEASSHYGIENRGVSGWLWRLRCYLLGAFSRT